MSYTTITSSGTVTNYHYDNSEFYTTKSTDEVILFKNKDNERVNINDCTFISSTFPLKISFFRTRENSEEIGYESDIIYIRPNFIRNLSGKDMDGVIVYGEAGQKIAWEADFY